MIKRGRHLDGNATSQVLDGGVGRLPQLSDEEHHDDRDGPD